LVLLLHYQPTLSNVQAAACVGLHPNSVRLWRQRWAKGIFDLEDQPGRGRKPSFSPSGRATITALACERVALTQNPLSRQSLGDLSRLTEATLGKPVSPRTVGRILDEDAIKPWQYEHWIFPARADFFDKAAVVLDLYEGRWQGERLGMSDYVISSDEKTSIQARIRCADTLPPGPGRVRRVEHEYERGGALQYLAGWDVGRGVVTGRCEASTGIEPFGRLVKQVMEQEPYRSASGCSGWWTTVRRTAAKQRESGCSRGMATRYW